MRGSLHFPASPWRAKDWAIDLVPQVYDCYQGNCPLICLFWGANRAQCFLVPWDHRQQRGSCKRACKYFLWLFPRLSAKWAGNNTQLPDASWKGLDGSFNALTFPAADHCLASNLPVSGIWQDRWSLVPQELFTFSSCVGTFYIFHASQNSGMGFSAT